MIFLYFFILSVWVANVNGRISSNEIDEIFKYAEREIAGNSWTNKIFSKSHHNPSYASSSSFYDWNTRASWNHENQRDWPNLFKTCGGEFQSPININNIYVEEVKTNACLRWFNYDKSFWELILENNGHSLDASATAWATNPPAISGGVLGNSLYKLDAIHWHWGYGYGHGSEHTIDNQAFHLEMHLVHYDSIYRNVGEAVASGHNDALAVVGILYEIGEESDDGIIAITEAVRNQKPNGVQNAYLPLDELVDTFEDGYYAYFGSLTTPTCNQVVKWIVSDDIQEIAFNELAVFQSLKNEDGNPLINNYRHVQPLNERQIIYVYSCEV